MSEFTTCQQENESCDYQQLKADNARLVALCGEDKRALDVHNKNLAAENALLREANAKLQEELAAAKKDAERYRWLVVEKSELADLGGRWDACYSAWDGCDGAYGFTAAIDAAMKEQQS